MYKTQCIYNHYQLALGHYCILLSSLDSLSADVLPKPHTFILIWIHYQLVYCHHCTLRSPIRFTINFCITYHYCTLLSTIRWCTASTVHCYPLWIHYKQVCYHHCTLQSSLQFTYQLLYWHYGTLLSSYGFTISWCNAITAHFYHHFDPLFSLHTIIFSWIHYQLVHCHYCTIGFSFGISGGVKTQ
jgi:hypothetical protein